MMYKLFTIFIIVLIFANVLCDGKKNFKNKKLKILEVFSDFDKFRDYIGFNITDKKTTCYRQLKELNDNNPNALWDIFDSTSKLWNGLSVSSRTDFGSYDQCVNVYHVPAEGEEIVGKYCLFGFIIPNPNNITNVNSYFEGALCMPKNCTAQDFIDIFNYPLFQDKYCNTNSDLTTYTNGDIGFIIVASFFGLLLIGSTTFDVYLYKTNTNSPHPLLIAFSVFSNGRKLVQTTKGTRDQIKIFNGMKTISMAWIISGHAIISWQTFPVINEAEVTNYLNTIKAAYISTSLFAVDTFFFMSGFLLAYSYLKQKNRSLKQQIFGLPYMILHRYFRLTPAVAMLYFWTLTVFKHLGSGPLWNFGKEYLAKPCRKYWLPYFLYIQNYYNYKQEDLCMVQTWYLSADMQMFIISIILLIPLSVILAKGPMNLKLVMIIMAVMNVTFTLLPLAFELIFPDYRNEYGTHTRLIDYLVGITLGIYLREAKDKHFLSIISKGKSIVNLILWIVALVTLFCVGILQHVATHNGFTNAEYDITISLLRPIWCWSLSWMVYSCYHGYGGIINWILTRPTLQITAKLSYCMYLLHNLVVMHYLMVTRTRLWFNDYIAFVYWCGYFIMTLVFSVIWTLSFESPFIILEKFIFGGGAPRKRTQRKEPNVEKGTAQTDVQPTTISKTK